MRRGVILLLCLFVVMAFWFRRPADTLRSSEAAGHIVSYSTTLNPAERSRNHNIALGAAAIDGITLEPGAEFSFNSATGPRTSTAGYLEARVIRDGRGEAGIGGGICQVSSTLYNAALLAGFEITERRHHSRPVSYVPLGRDATVVYGGQDLKFKNTLSGLAVINAYVSGDRLVICVESQTRFPEIEMRSEVIDTVYPRPMAPPGPTGRALSPPAMGSRRVQDPGAMGYVVNVWRVFRVHDGQTRHELVSTDFYEPVNAVIGE